MKQLIVSIVLILSMNQCLSQKGFPKQFQATLNISGANEWNRMSQGVQKLVYDYTNLRVRFDIYGLEFEQNEAYIIKYKPEGAEANSVSTNKLFMTKILTTNLF